MSSSMENPLVVLRGEVSGFMPAVMEVACAKDAKWLERCRCEGCPQVRRPSDLSAISKSWRGLMSVCVNKWVFKLDRWLKQRWQMGHRWGDSSMCKIRCTANVRDWQNPLPHSLHLKGFSLEWMYLWSRKWSCLRKALPQISQLKGLSSVWVLSWISKLYDLVNSRLQYLQMKRFFGLDARPGRCKRRGSYVGG